MTYLTEKGKRYLEEVIRARKDSGIESITVWRSDFIDFPWLESRLCRLVMSGRVLVIEQRTNFMRLLDVVAGSVEVLYRKEIDL